MTAKRRPADAADVPASDLLKLIDDLMYELGYQITRVEGWDSVEYVIEKRE